MIRIVITSVFAILVLCSATLAPGKTKERDIVERIIKKFPNFGWIADKRIEDGCSKRRPDLLK